MTNSEAFSFNGEEVVQGADYERLPTRLKSIVLDYIAYWRLEREQTFYLLLSVYGRHLSKAALQDKTVLHLINDEMTSRERRLAQKVDSLRNQLSSLRKENAQIASEKGALKRENLKISEENKELKSQLENRGASVSATPNHNLERENQKLLKENRKLKYEIDKKAEEFHRQEKEIGQLRADLESYKEQLEHMTASKAQEEKQWEKRLKEAQQEAENAKRLANFREALLTNPSPKSIPEKPRVGLFVDGQNMFYAARDEYDASLDYTKLLHFAASQRILTKAIAYIVETSDGDLEDFISFLTQTGYEVKSKVRKVRADKSTKGDWDVGIAMDIVSMLDDLDIVTLASGDGDFAPLGDLVRAKGRYLEVIAFPHSAASELIQAADAFIAIGADMTV